MEMATVLMVRIVFNTMNEISSFFKIALFFILLSSCKDSNNRRVWDRFTSDIVDAKNIETFIPDDYVSINIDSATDINAMDFSKEFVEKAEYIPLRSRGLIGNVDYVIINDNRIFVLDTYLSKKVFIFNRKGEFINYAGRVGQGPGEYVMPESIFLDHSDGILGVCDNNLFVNYYDFDGKFIKRIRRLPGSYSIDFKGYLFNVLGYGVYSKNSEDSYQLVCSDSVGNVVSRGFKTYPLQKSVPHSMKNLRNSNSELLFTPLLSDTTYVVKDNFLMEAKYIFIHDKSSSVWKDEYLNQDKKTFQELVSTYELQVVSSPVTITTNFISFPILSGNKYSNKLFINQYWFDKTSKKTYRFVNEMPGILPGQDFENPISFPLNSLKDKFIGYLPPESFDFFRKIRREMNLNFINSDLDSLLDEEKVDQAIVLYKLK